MAIGNDFELQITISAVAESALESLKEIGNQIKRIVKDAGLVNGIGASFTVASKAISNMGKSLDTLSKQLKKFGRDFTMNVTAPLAAIGALALNKLFNEAYFGRGSAVANEFGGAIQSLKKDFDNLLITIGEQLAPIATRVISFFRNLIAAYQSLSPSTKELILNFGLIAAAIGPLTLAFSSIASIIGKLLTVIGPIISFLPTLIGLLSSTTAGVIAVGVAIGGLINVYLDLRKSGVGAWEAILDTLKLYFSFLGKVIGMWAGFYSSIVKNMAKVAGLINKDFGDALSGVGDKISNFGTMLDSNFDSVKADLDSKLSEIGTSVGNSFTFGLKDSLANAKLAFEDFTKNTAPPIKSFYKEIEQSAHQLKLTISGGLADAFLDIAEGSKTAEQAFRDFARSTIRMLTQMILQAQLFRLLFPAGGAASAGANAIAGAGFVPAPGFASGGHVRGPGTGTSDSIMARLSNGEFVTDAKTVSAFGVNFFHNLKAMARGGAPTRKKGPIPAFADGGFVGGGGSAPQVVIQNNGTPKEATETSYDASTAVTSVVLEDVQRNGPISKSLQRNFGMRRGGYR